MKCANCGHDSIDHHPFGWDERRQLTREGVIRLGDTSQDDQLPPCHHRDNEGMRRCPCPGFRPFDELPPTESLPHGSPPENPEEFFRSHSRAEAGRERVRRIGLCLASLASIAEFGSEQASATASLFMHLFEALADIRMFGITGAQLFPDIREVLTKFRAQHTPDAYEAKRLPVDRMLAFLRRGHASSNQLSEPHLVSYEELLDVLRGLNPLLDDALPEFKPIAGETANSGASGFTWERFVVKDPKP